ncbi:MAG: YdcF family protein [Alphaproteobacteria bacterium]|nr:YdcF family protein [Alphaproteobacteria bacterium]
MIKKIAIITSLIIIISWLSGFICFAQRINNYQPDTHTRTEAIIALTGGRHRIAEAIKFLNFGLADKLFISGVSRNVSLANIAHRQNLSNLPHHKITIGQQARDTIGNATETTAWLKKNHIHSIRLVTSNYHVERSVIEFRAQNPDLIIIPHPVYSEHVSKKWWTTWHTFSLIFSEYNKFLYVYIRTKFLL